MSNKFGDGSGSAYAELPVPASYLQWTRGDAKLRPLVEKDPGAYFGGWRAFVTDRDKNALPELPLAIVQRTSEDGKHLYKVYASNVVEFLPVQHRTRFEKRIKVHDEQTGREIEKIVALSKERQEGYAPYRQVFGMLFNPDSFQFNYAVLKVFKWSAFISFEKAGQAWNKIKVPEGSALIRRYGSVGTKDKESGATIPNFQMYNDSRSTPIEAVGTDKPRFLKITKELEELYDASEAWRLCPRWNAEGKFSTDAEPALAIQKEFEDKCISMFLTNIESAAILKENGGDYVKALAAITGDSINTELENGDR